MLELLQRVTNLSTGFGRIDVRPAPSLYEPCFLRPCELLGQGMSPPGFPAKAGGGHPIFQGPFAHVRGSCVCVCVCARVFFVLCVCVLCYVVVLPCAVALTSGCAGTSRALCTWGPSLQRRFAAPTTATQRLQESRCKIASLP